MKQKNLTKREKDRIVDRLNKISLSLVRTGYAVINTIVNTNVGNVHIIIGYHVPEGKIATHRFTITLEQLDNLLDIIIGNLSNYIHPLTDEENESFFAVFSDDYIKENDNIQEYKK